MHLGRRHPVSCFTRIFWYFIIALFDCSTSIGHIDNPTPHTLTIPFTPTKLAAE